MSDLWPRIEPLLARVEKPARYIGMEQGSVRPQHEAGRVAFLLIYPDTYEIGLPNQGLQILYEILNERPDAVAERAYSPWTDMESSMRAAGLPLFSVDTHRAARDFDVLAFNLSAELVYTNLLNLVDLAGVAVRNEDRAPADPIVTTTANARRGSSATRRRRRITTPAAVAGSSIQYPTYPRSITAARVPRPVSKCICCTSGTLHVLASRAPTTRGTRER